jgi:hypothetical protein
MSQQCVTVPSFREIADGDTVSLQNSAGFSVLTSASTTVIITSYFDGRQISQMTLPESQTLEISSNDSNALSEIRFEASGGSVYLVSLGGSITTI